MNNDELKLLIAMLLFCVVIAVLIVMLSGGRQ